MLDATARVPAAVDVGIVIPVFVVKVLTLRLGAIHTVETQSVEVVRGVLLSHTHNLIKIYVAAARTGRRMDVLKLSETVNDLLDRRPGDDIFDGEGIDAGQGAEVLADCRVPAGTIIGAVAKKMTALFVKTFVE
jgi:hypothetical protein